MNSKKAPATQESINALSENLGWEIESSALILKNGVIFKEILDEKNIQDDMDRILDAFLTLNNFTLYIYIELASVLRADFRANLDVEKRYNIKWVNCAILEGYKHLYGYGSKRKKSVWMSKIKPLLEVFNNKEFQQDVRILEDSIAEFGDSNITNLEQRDLSFHYDIEPLLVYNMLIGLSEEEEVQRMIHFMDLLQKILRFASKYTTPIKMEPKALLKYAFSFSDSDIFQNSKDKIYSTMENEINYHALRLDTFIRQQCLPELIKQHFKDADGNFTNPINRVLEIQKVAIHLTYLYIDLASAMRAFISSEYTIEKQFSLKQINTIILEGYNKLYGLNEDSKDSFWTKYVYPIVLDCDDTIIEEFKSMEEEFHSLKMKIKTFDKQRQLSVHLEDGICKVYSMLHSLNPIEEFQKASELLNFLPKILNFLTKCIQDIALENQIDHEKKMAPTYEKIDNVIHILKKQPDCAQKEDLIRKLEDLKSGKLFDELMRKKRK